MFDLKKYVVEVLDKNSNVCQDFFQGEYDETFHERWNTNPPTHFSSHGVTFTCVQSHGGEGEGSSYYTVYKFTKDDQEVFVKFDGWYASYDGSYYDKYFLVTPKQVTVTQYL